MVERAETIIVSVLESLRLYLPIFSLANVIEEVQRWFEKVIAVYSAAATTEADTAHGNNAIGPRQSSAAA